MYMCMCWNVPWALFDMAEKVSQGPWMKGFPRPPHIAADSQLIALVGLLWKEWLDQGQGLLSIPQGIKTSVGVETVSSGEVRHNGTFCEGALILKALFLGGAEMIQGLNLQKNKKFIPGRSETL